MKYMQIIFLFLVLNIFKIDSFAKILEEKNRSNENEQEALKELFDVMWEGNAELAKEIILHKKFDVNGRDSLGRTPIIEARYLPIEITKFLIDKGADVNAMENDGFTTLIQLSRLQVHNVLDKIKLLLLAGANPDIQETLHGNTALNYSISYGLLENVKLLLHAGTDLELLNYNQNSGFNVARLFSNSNETGPLIFQLVSNEPKRRAQKVKKWQEKVANKLIAIGYPKDLAKIISEYQGNYNDIPIAERLEE